MTAAPPEFVGARTIGPVPAAIDERTPEGHYRLVGDQGRRMPLLLIDEATPEIAAAAVLPLDADFLVRIDAAHRLWRLLCGRPIARPPRFTPQQRQRLGLTLRALDAKLENEAYRVIAQGLFGDERVPEGRAWKTHDLQSKTRRLVRDGIKLMQSGYLHLLRSPLRGEK